MSTSERAKVLNAVTVSPLSKTQVLAQMGVPRRTYYNWVRREKQKVLRDGACGNKRPWNKVGEEEEQLVIEIARSSPKAVAPDN